MKQEEFWSSLPRRSQWNCTFTRAYLSVKISSPLGPTTVAVCGPRTVGLAGPTRRAEFLRGRCGLEADAVAVGLHVAPRRVARIDEADLRGDHEILGVLRLGGETLQREHPPGADVARRAGYPDAAVIGLHLLPAELRELLAARQDQVVPGIVVELAFREFVGERLLGLRHEVRAGLLEVVVGVGVGAGPTRLPGIHASMHSRSRRRCRRRRRDRGSPRRRPRSRESSAVASRRISL